MKRILTVFLLFFLSMLFFSFKTENAHSPTPLIIDYGKLGLEVPVELEGNPLTIEGVTLGRFLFYDSTLSINYKQSCSSCHKQSNCFTDGYTTSIGTLGDTLKRNAMPLFNLAWQKEFFWDGRKKSIEDLIVEPLTAKDEMAMDTNILFKRLKAHPYYPKLFFEAFNDSSINVSTISKAIAQFLRTIIVKPVVLPDSLLNIPPDGIREQDFSVLHFKDENLRGVYFRFAEMCGSCHISDVYSGYNKNFDKVNDSKSLMKVPSLYNLRYTAPYMHDGRFKTLREVTLHYRENIRFIVNNTRKGIDKKPAMIDSISEYDMSQLLVFLRFFEDTTIITNSNYGNPFKRKDSSDWLNKIR